MKSEPKAFASLSSGLLARKGAARPAMRPQGFGQGGHGLEDLGWNDMGHEPHRPPLVPVDSPEFEPAPAVSRTPLAGLTPVSPVHEQYAEIEERFTSGDEPEGEDAPASFDQDPYSSEEAETVAESFAYAPLVAALPADRFDSAEPEEEMAGELPEAMPQPLAPLGLAPSALDPAPGPVLEPSEEPAPPALAVGTAEPVSRPVKPVASRSRAGAKAKAAFTLRLDPERHLKLRLACAVRSHSAQQLVTRALDQLLASMPELDAMASQAPEGSSRKG